LEVPASALSTSHPKKKRMINKYIYQREPQKRKPCQKNHIPRGYADVKELNQKPWNKKGKKGSGEKKGARAAAKKSGNREKAVWGIVSGRGGSNKKDIQRGWGSGDAP